MKRLPIAALSLCLALAACDEGSEANPPAEADFETVLRQLTVPEEHLDGEILFNANCATCHGERALGTDRGPPLAHIIYEPSHHADVAFVIAAERGVRAHHWNFGDMAPVPAVNREQLQEIVAYVRFLQQEVGIR
jgi:mono/diheme cytochrome c family protein